MTGTFKFTIHDQSMPSRGHPTQSSEALSGAKAGIVWQCGQRGSALPITAPDLMGAQQEQGAEVVVALTHMRLPNDVICARDTVGIDIVLGGHDHDYSITQMQSADSQPVYVVKSGAAAAAQLTRAV